MHASHNKIWLTLCLAFLCQLCMCSQERNSLFEVTGFTHSAFTLGYEAAINTSSIDGGMVPPGSLITFVQRGLQYLEMEANLTNEETCVDEDFSFLQPLDLITKNVDELRQSIKERKKNLLKENEKDKEKSKDDRDREKSSEHEQEREIEQEREAEHSRVREKTRQKREKELEIVGKEKRSRKTKIA